MGTAANFMVFGKFRPVAINGGFAWSRCYR